MVVIRRDQWVTWKAGSFLMDIDAKGSVVNYSTEPRIGPEHKDAPKWPQIPG